MYALDEPLTLNLRRNAVEGYNIVVNEDIYIVFGHGIWAQILSSAAFDKTNEYIEQLIQEGQTSNLEKGVSELFDEIGVKECNEVGR